MTILFFDLETEVNPPAVELLDEPAAPANYKDADKIAQYVAEKKAERFTTAALDADLGKIVAISCQLGIKGKLQTCLVGDESTPTEKDLIAWFWRGYKKAGGVSCGYNILGFDLPYLMRRSMDLGVTVPIVPQLAKYRTNPTIDLMAILYNWGYSKGLKWVCKRYGIKNELPDLDGSKVAEMDRDTLRKYAGNDVYLAVELYKKMCGVYLPELIEPQSSPA